MKENGLGFAHGVRRGASEAGGKTFAEDVLALVSVVGGLAVVTLVVHLLVAQMFS